MTAEEIAREVDRVYWAHSPHNRAGCDCTVDTACEARRDAAVAALVVRYANQRLREAMQACRFEGHAGAVAEIDALLEPEE